MRDQDWDDDSAYRSAARRARVTMAVALVVTLLAAGVVAVAVLGTVLFLDFAEVLGR